MIDVQYKDVHGGTHIRQLSNLAQLHAWTEVFRDAIVTYRAFSNYREIERGGMSLCQRIRRCMRTY